MYLDVLYGNWPLLIGPDGPDLSMGIFFRRILEFLNGNSWEERGKAMLNNRMSQMYIFQPLGPLST